MKKMLIGVGAVLTVAVSFFAGANINVSELSRQEPEPTVWSEPVPLPFIGDSKNGIPLAAEQPSKQEAAKPQQPATKSPKPSTVARGAAFDPYKYALDVNAYSGVVEYPTIKPHDFGKPIRPIQVEYPKVRWQSSTDDCHVAILYCD